MKTDVLFSSESNEWETPQDFFDELDREFYFDLDACATPENKKCAEFFTPEQDGLAQNWGGRKDGLVQSSLWPRHHPLGAEGI